MPRFDPDLIQAACTDGDARAIEEFSTTLSGNLVQREARTRQGETQLVVRGEALPPDNRFAGCSPWPMP